MMKTGKIRIILRILIIHNTNHLLFHAFNGLGFLLNSKFIQKNFKKNLKCLFKIVSYDAENVTDYE